MRLFSTQKFSISDDATLTFVNTSFLLQKFGSSDAKQYSLLSACFETCFSLKASLVENVSEQSCAAQEEMMLSRPLFGNDAAAAAFVPKQVKAEN